MKKRVYAHAGIREYWVVDLGACVVEVYSEPRDGTYRAMWEFRSGESISVTLDGVTVGAVAVAAILTPAALVQSTR